MSSVHPIVSFMFSGGGVIGHANGARFLVFIVLVIVPISLMLFFQVGFLPYHSEEVAWVHRMAVTVCVVSVLLLNP